MPVVPWQFVIAINTIFLYKPNSTSMASSQDHSAMPPQFILTPQQQNLLFRALTSNQPNTAPSPAVGSEPLSLSPSSLQNPSPAVHSLVTPNAFQESPFLDYDYDLGQDSTFDFDFSGGQGKMIGELPGTNNGASAQNEETKSGSSEPESSDKRSHPDDDEEGNAEEGGGKRRESESKTQKKAGRKPLTNEPTSVSISRRPDLLRETSTDEDCRRGKLRIGLRNARSASVRRSTFWTWRPKLRSLKRHPRPLLPRTLSSKRRLTS